MSEYPRDLLISESVIRDFEERVGVRFVNKTECAKALKEHDAEVRADAVNEFTTDIINKINFEDKWLFACKSNNADTDIVFSTLRSFVNDRAEQLKKRK